MFGFLNKSRGAVSVFLVIILVPMITCASLFVDASRAKSATGVVSSAGDLTLNTLLSEYDIDLNDYYGLMASAQDTTEIMSIAEDYFVECITSTNVNFSDASKVGNAVTGLLTGETDVDDLLGIRLQDGEKVNIEKVQNGALTNPALVKTQIVEFMKYRAPINGIAELLEKFKSTSKDLENSSKNSDLVDKKEEYYEAQGKVAEKAYETYKLIEEYNKLGIDKSFIEDSKTLIESLEAEYLALHKKMVKDLYNTQGMTSEDFYYMKKISDVTEKPSPYFDESNLANEAQIKKQLNSTIASYNQYLTAQKNFNDTYKTKTQNDYGLQYYAHIKLNSSVLTTYRTKQTNVINSYIKLKNMLENAEEGVLSKTITTTNYVNYPAKTGTIGSLCNGVLSDIKTDTDYAASGNSKYYKIVSSLKSIFNSDYALTSTTATDNKIADLYNQLSANYEIYKEASDLLEKIYKALGKLRSAVEKADKELEEWSSSAEDYKNDITLAKNDCEEIKDLNAGGKLSVEDIDAYKKRINNVKSAMGKLKKATQNCKYNDTSIIDYPIDAYSDFKKVSPVLNSEIPINKYDLDDYAKNTFKFSIDKENLSINITKNNNPNIKDSDVYKWMVKQGFPTATDEKVKQGKKDKKDAKKKADDQAAEVGEPSSVCSSNDISTLEISWLENTSTTGDDKPSNNLGKVSSFVSGLFTDFSSTVSQTAVNARDAFYCLDYITSMFTYETYEYEAKFSLLENDTKNLVTRNNYPKYYEQFNSVWENPAVGKGLMLNKTLTNKMRASEASNWSYGNEVEYIMYGGNNSQNKNSLGTSIFMIRFALNIPVVFSAFWNKTDLNEFAVGIQALTHGIVPASLIKIIVCTGLVCLESSIDLKTLRAGIPVILIKTKEEDLFVENWKYSTRETPITKITDSVTFQYSDYMKLLLFIKLLSSESDDIYLRTAAVIQTNMSKCVLKSDGYTFTKSQVYYKLSAKVEVPLLMLESQYVEIYLERDLSESKWNKISYSAIRGY